MCGTIFLECSNKTPDDGEIKRERERERERARKKERHSLCASHAVRVVVYYAFAAVETQRNKPTVKPITLEKSPSGCVPSRVRL